MSGAGRRPDAAQHLRDLARLRRVRDRIDREYAQPLDVEALARDAHMSAGHFSREFRLAYGESPYSYLMTRRIERAMALLRRGDLSVTEVCFEVGCSSLGTFSTRFTELVGMPPSTYRRHAAGETAGMAPCVAKQRDQTDQESRSAGPERHLAVPSHGHHHSLRACSRTTTRRPPWPSIATPSASRSATTSNTNGMHWITLGPPDQPDTSIVLYPPDADPGITDDERRMVAEMMAKGTYASINLASKDLDGTFERLQAGDGRGRPGADRPAVRDSRLRPPGSRGQPDPHPGVDARHVMSVATKTDTQPAAPHAADSHELIRVHGARVNNLKDVSIEIPKRRLTVFTGVSGSGKSSLVFGTIAAESQRLINETYSAFVQGFMPTLARPEVDVLDGLTTAISVDQERMGSNPRSTVGTATDADAMLRILFSRLGQPHIGSPGAYSFNVASVHGSGGITVERGEKTRTEKATFSRTGGMCPRCEGRGSVSDFDLSALYDDSKSLNEGALTIPGYSMDGWYGRIFRGCGYFDPDKPIKKFNKRELHDLLYKEPTKIKVEGINLTYAGLIPQIQKSMLSKDVDAMQPHIRAFVERAVVFTTCPDCGGTRLSEAARSSKIDGVNIADVSAMQINDLSEWVRGLDEPSVAPLLEALQETLDSFVEIGLGYLSLNRPSGTLSGGEAQRTKMIRHLGSSLTDVTYVFDEPTIGLHPHDVERMNDLLLQLRDKGNTVLVVEHEPEAIEIADHVVDLGPGAGTEGGEVVFEGTSKGCGPAARSRAAISTTGPP